MPLVPVLVLSDFSPLESCTCSVTGARWQGARRSIWGSGTGDSLFDGILLEFFLSL